MYSRKQRRQQSGEAGGRIYAENNVLATQRLLEAAKRADLHKLVCASSSSIYGDAENYPTFEELIPKPISPYGVTRFAGERLCYFYWRYFGGASGYPAIFSVYGSRQRRDMAFYKFIKAMLDGGD